MLDTTGLMQYINNCIIKSHIALSATAAEMLLFSYDPPMSELDGNVHYSGLRIHLYTNKNRKFIVTHVSCLPLETQLQKKNNFLHFCEAYNCEAENNNLGQWTAGGLRRFRRDVIS